MGGDHTPTALNSILFTFMRKIESQMCQAVQANINWKNANTEVTIDKETNTSSVYLHGNLIATVTDNDMTIYDGGWQSNTTKSRLNALCDAFCVDGEGVFQKDFTWYVRKFVGCINGKNIFKTEDFESGYIFAWFIMRIFLSALVIILGANLLISLLDSNLVDVMEERRNTIERLMKDS